MCLPGFAADIFQESVKKKRPTVTTEKNLLPDRNRWWKIMNNLDEKFGKVSPSGAFETMSHPAYELPREGCSCGRRWELLR